LLLLIVIAAPLVGLTEPVELIRMSPEPDVESGVVVAVLMTVSAPEMDAVVRKRVPIAVEAKR
jgi:hypothetical protein